MGVSRDRLRLRVVLPRLAIAIEGLAECTLLQEDIAEQHQAPNAIRTGCERALHRCRRSIEVAGTESTEPAADQAGKSSAANLVTKLRFVEVNEQGDPIGEAKDFDIVGDMVYIDYMRVTFDDKYVAESDLDRSTAIALFQRIFGEHQQAAEGFQLDEVGTRPTAYARGTPMSDFEKKIWSDFWLIANDPQRAAEMGAGRADRRGSGGYPRRPEAPRS